MATATKDTRQPQMAVLPGSSLDAPPSTSADNSGTAGGVGGSSSSTTPPVRARPRLPASLLRARHVSDQDKHVHELVGVLSSFRHTDFVRKYSFKGRSPSCLSGGSSPTPSLSRSSPSRSPLLSPGSRTPELTTQRPGTSVTLPRVRSLKIRLDNLKPYCRDKGEAVRSSIGSKKLSASSELLGYGGNSHRIIAEEQDNNTYHEDKQSQSLESGLDNNDTDANNKDTDDRCHNSGSGMLLSTIKETNNGANNTLTPAANVRTQFSQDNRLAYPIDNSVQYSSSNYEGSQINDNHNNQTPAVAPSNGKSYITRPPVITTLSEDSLDNHPLSMGAASLESVVSSDGLPLQRTTGRASLESITSVGSDVTLPSYEDAHVHLGAQSLESVNSVTSETAHSNIQRQSTEEDTIQDSDGRNDPSARRVSLTIPTSSLDTEDEGMVITDMGPRYEDVYVTVTASTPGPHNDKGFFCPSTTTVSLPPQLQLHIDAQNNSQSSSSSQGNAVKRFLTHPPLRDRIIIREAGSMDSNGLGSLRSKPEAKELKTLDSVGSFTDSDVCSADTSVSPTHGEGASDAQSLGEDLTESTTTTSSKSKQLSHKSKSYPSGDKHTKTADKSSKSSNKLSLSSPIIKITREKIVKIKEKPPPSPITGQSVSPVSGSPPTSSARRGRGRASRELAAATAAETTALTSEEEDVPKKTPRRSSKRRQRHGAAVTLDKPHKSPGEETSAAVTVSVVTDAATESDTASASESTTSSVTASGLSLPCPTSPKASNLTRSHSSASVYLHKTAEQLARSKEAPEQRSVRKSRPSIPQQFGLNVSSAHGASTPELAGAGSSLAPSPSAQSKYRPGGGRNAASASPFSPSLEPIFSKSHLGLFQGKDNNKDKRSLIVQELVSTEQQYVEALQVLVERYMIPLKTQGILDSNLVDDIFYKVNEIYMHHAIFLTFLEKAVATWTPDTTVGDTIYKNFSKQTVIESYVSFIENFPKAEKVLDILSTKTSFQKFVDQIEKDTRTKLPIKAQIVKPAQRIPRYELLIKRLLENTDDSHPDYPLLKEAEKAIHKLALKINSVKESKNELDLQETLKKLELLLITDLVHPERQYLRHDMVAVLNRKDQCCVWLFTDLAIFSSIKRKSGPVNRKSSLLLRSMSGHDFVENTKHKLWLKIPLEDLEIIKAEQEKAEKNLVAKDILEADFQLLTDIQGLAGRLHTDHDQLEVVVKEIMGDVNKQLSRHQLKSPPPSANRVELLATTQEGLASITLVFPSQDKKQAWEASLVEAKNKLAAVIDGKPPDFLQALQITKTRAGMQFSCASPIDTINAKGFRDVWVCNSDGYVGHMCLLSLQPEPIVTLNTPVPGCNSRILTICSVPAAPHRHGSRKNSQKRRRGVTDPPRIQIQESEDPEEGYLSDSSSTSSSSYEDAEEAINLQLNTSSSVQELAVAGSTTSPESTPKLSNHPLYSISISTMWLGTEDGGIHIFPSTENIKTTKNKVKLQQNAGVLCITYMDQKVFASLANGVLVVYHRNEDGSWDVKDPETVTLTSANAPINKMLPVAGKLWCASLGDIMVVDPVSLEIDVTFSVNPDSRKGIQCLTSSGQGVWLAAQGSAKVVLFHATTYEQLAEVDIAPAVVSKLQGADDIIRQHKSACLRITALLTCKDLLWLGTSAGVLLTLPMPKITSKTQRQHVQPPTVTGLVYGHTGHVRFLTSVDIPMSTRTTKAGDKRHVVASNLGPHLSPANAAATNPISRTCTKLMVISGGDGYEDFRNTTPPETAGKDDSTNHLLLWQV